VDVNWFWSDPGGSGGSTIYVIPPACDGTAPQQAAECDDAASVTYG
jgi:hypothetical protein